MTAGPYQGRFQEILGRVAQPARLIGGEFGAGWGFTGGEGELRAVLAFPDTYDIGISNQALQILYHLARCSEGVEVERAYLPWVDVLAEMRHEKVPLLTLESWTAVAETDLFAVTLQHEFNFTNVLEMLDLGGLPVRAAEREEGPLVVGGGPAMANFLPMAPFFDAFAVGDGEEIFPEILETLVRAKRERAPRAEARARLARIAGVYVPGLSTTVTRRVVEGLEAAAYPASCLVPLTAGVHDRAWVEIMRGCARGCRFCQAGMWYRPVRERTVDEIMEMTSAQLGATGHQELALASLSTTDYTGLEPLLGRLVREHPEVRLSLPSLRVDSAAVRLAHLASPTGPSLTLAPEAGSQRMRDIINKNVTEADIMAAAEEAFRGGCTTLKLYFIIGFPLETDADVEAITALCLHIRELGRRVLGPRASRLQLNISVNNFVPKPFTPFQWAAMADRQTLRARQDLLRRGLRKPGVRLALHDVGKSFLEAALARGGTEMGDVIEAAWRQGARFDSWTEQFRRDAWEQAFAAHGATAEELATRELPLGAQLAWDVIRGSVTKDFLRSEWERALRGETTPDCRWDDCSDCGVCVPGVDHRLAGAVSSQFAGAADRAEALETPLAAGRPGGETPALTYLLTFAVTGRARFVGHLDKTEIFRRAVRRAGGTLALSAGMRPKALLTLALPLAVGLESERELCEFTLAAAPASGFFTRLREALPPGFVALSLEPYRETRPAAARVAAAHYDLEVQAGGAGGALEDAAKLLESAPSLPVQDRRGERTRTVDVKHYVDRVEVERLGDDRYLLRLRIGVTPRGSVRPERVLEALTALGGPQLTLLRGTRTRIELR